MKDSQGNRIPIKTKYPVSHPAFRFDLEPRRHFNRTNSFCLLQNMYQIIKEQSRHGI